MEEGLLPTSSPFLVQNGNYINDTIYRGDKDNSNGMLRNDSSVTFVLVLSTFVVVCSSFTYGCTAGHSSPAESGIVADLGLSLAEIPVTVLGVVLIDISGRRPLLMLLAAGMGLSCFLVGGLSFLLQDLHRLTAITPILVFISLLYAVSVQSIGGIIGAVTSRKIANFMGRRRTMWLSGIFCIMGWLAIVFAKNAWWIDLGRLSTGLGVGLISYGVPVYVAEIYWLLNLEEKSCIS